MSEHEGSRLKGVATITLMGLNLVFWVVPLMLVAVLKLVVPKPANTPPGIASEPPQSIASRNGSAV